MSKSRAELDADLYQLHAAIPLWRKALPTEGAVYAKYQEMSADLLAATSCESRAWVESQLRNLLVGVGSARRPAREHHVEAQPPQTM